MGAVATRRLGLELSVWTDPGDHAFLLAEPAPHGGLVLGAGHHRLAIRRPVVSSAADIWLTQVQREWAQRRVAAARKQARDERLAWVYTALVAAVCAGAVLVCWWAGQHRRRHPAPRTLGDAEVSGENLDPRRAASLAASIHRRGGDPDCDECRVALADDIRPMSRAELDQLSELLVRLAHWVHTGQELPDPEGDAEVGPDAARWRPGGQR
jgi:hypothetical protein